MIPSVVSTAPMRRVVVLQCLRSRVVSGMIVFVGESIGRARCGVFGGLEQTRGMHVESGSLVSLYVRCLLVGLECALVGDGV